MSLSSRTGGTVIAVFGLALAAFHVGTISAARGESAAHLLADGFLPLVLSAAVVAAGVQFARSEGVADQFVPRALSWVAVGVVVLVAATTWLYATGADSGGLPPNLWSTLANAATFGGLIGYLVGVYDVGRRQQQVRADQLNRINDTLRIATREVVAADTRDDLERRVCERIQQSGSYESAWIGRYEPGDDELTPVAWAGLEDDYYEPLAIPLDEDVPEGRGAGGRAVRTGEIQCSQDVFADPSMEPWHDLFAEHGVESVAVVPITHDGTVYGVLSVYANRAYVFDEPEREVLAELGETIGHAVTSIEARTQLRRRERELASQNDRLEEFASVVSHDLRNPLNVAEGSVELARAEGDSEALQRASRALTRMNELVEDVLALARSGQVVSEFDSVDLGGVAAEAWQTTETRDATLDVAASLGTVAGDESRIRELFENLFRNAVEHGGDDVAVEVGELADGSGFYVADDGPGVPESDRENVFDAGFTTSPDGTGFGLNIVESIADAHGWTVSVTDSEAGGARFEFANAGAEDQSGDGRAAEPAADASARREADAVGE
ncbi:histidine kinase [Halobacterium hubeiense]|uniref:histidine kinase n=1 Tax=Halobacterium hubeiense TaxID=1407499 RepID=A0A0U5H1D2_9EURY|nr:GAF domain-containing protein [Halobacterium hubeiense]CQH52193.1 histidine kinase [Halobacterium hubeiense]